MSTIATDSVLIVEDEKDLRNVYQLILKTQGYDVHVAVNGKEGLEAVNRYHPKLVILDIFMPVMDGRDFLKNIDLETYPNMKIVVCSNTSDTNLREEVTDLGATKVVLKADLTPTDLIGLVRPYFS